MVKRLNDALELELSNFYMAAHATKLLEEMCVACKKYEGRISQLKDMGYNVKEHEVRIHLLKADIEKRKILER